MPHRSADAAGAARALCRTAEAAGWTGPDIYDALGASWPRFLTAGKRRRQALIQLHVRSPVDFRPLSRRRHARIAKALALFAMADLRLARLEESTVAAAGAARALELLSADHKAGPLAWGYPWEVQTRWGHYPKDTPNVIVTAFAIQALRAGAIQLGLPEHNERAAAAAGWVQDQLFVEDLGVYAYHPGSRSVIHNATLLGARAAWSIRDRDAAVRPAVERAVERTLAAQKPDGSFPYGEGSGMEFVDSFHTAYVLECLADLSEVDTAVQPALNRGIAYYDSHFFDAAGRAVLWPGKPYPEDAHSAGSGLTALCRLRAAGIGSEDLIERVSQRAVTAMISGGHAIHRRYRWGPTRVTYVRWADSHMALGLANAAAVLTLERAGAASPAPARNGQSP